MQRPPLGVKMVIEAVCIMKEVKPKKVLGEKLGTKVDDYWEPGRGLLQDPGKFLDSLFKYDKVSGNRVELRLGIGCYLAQILLTAVRLKAPSRQHLSVALRVRKCLAWQLPCQLASLLWTVGSLLFPMVQEGIYPSPLLCFSGLVPEQCDSLAPLQCLHHP